MTTSNFKISHFASPHQYSAQYEEMSPSKGPRHIISTSSPARNSGFIDQIGLSRSDSVGKLVTD